MRTLILLLAVITMLASCGNKKLPVYGIKTPVTKTIEGKQQVDSLDYTIPDFNLFDQDSSRINEAAIANKIYVADFFFTSCPSICPKMKKELLRVYDKYKSNDNITILSYSIDPARDSVARLKSYAQKLGVDDSKKWHFLTGNKDSIYNLADKYLVSAEEDPDAPGGHIHSGNFILVDKQKRIRGYYDGTKTESVDKLLDEMDQLLQEK
jgi:protein SCO1/2